MLFISVAKTFVGPQLRQLRSDRRQTQAEMAKMLGISADYVNLLENNERSLSLRILMAVADNYGVDWRDLVADKTSNLLAELRSVIKDPMFSATPDLTELRAAIDHAPRLVEQFLHLFHRNTLERLMRYGSSTAADRLLATSAEAVVHDFFQDNLNYFHEKSRIQRGLDASATSTENTYCVSLSALLRASHERPRRRTADKRDELAASHAALPRPKGRHPTTSNRSCCGSRQNQSDYVRRPPTNHAADVGSLCDSPKLIALSP